jgi:hypothetical protein
LTLALTLAFVDGFDFPELLSATASRTSALKAEAFTSSPFADVDRAARVSLEAGVERGGMDP